MNIIRLDVGDRPTATVHRDSGRLASRHGYDSVDSFANDIPEGESVIDIGASISRLGHEIAGLRPDIEWVNFDIEYSSPVESDFSKRLQTTIADAPPNLHFIAGNILCPPSEIKARSFGLVLSYWMLPHLVEHDYKQGLVAISNMFALGKVGGTASIGPLRSPSDNAGRFIIPETIEDTAKLAVKIAQPWKKQ